MHKLTIGILAFAAGWGLSWLSHDDPGQDSPAPLVASPAQALNSAQAPAAIAARALADSDDIDSLLQGNQLEAAVERYEALQFQLNRSAAADARSKILRHARQLLAQSRFNPAGQLLQRFLIAAFRDVEARLLLAEVYLGTQNVELAIDQLYEARGHAYRSQVLQQINSRIRTVVAEHSTTLTANDEQAALLALYQQLSQLEPEHAPWFIGLASAQLALDDRESARRSLLLVVEDPDAGAQAQNMLAQLEAASSEMHIPAPPLAATELAGIPLQRRGNHFMVDASPARNRNIRLLIDTGASLTMLSPAIFQQRGIPYKNSGRSELFHTANGPVRAPVYILESLSVGDHQVNQLEVGVLSINQDSPFDGLLGMNFLQHFQFFIDQNQALLRLSEQ